MTELVIDASIAVKWWRQPGERHVPEALALRDSFRAGELRLAAPPIFNLEVLNVLGRRARWAEAGLVALAAELRSLNVGIEEPDLRAVARWVARGLTAYDASYVALAETRRIQVITADDQILQAAPEIARPLAA